MQSLNLIGAVLQVPFVCLTLISTFALCISIYKFQASESFEKVYGRKRLIISSFLCNAAYTVVAVLCVIQSVYRLQASSPDAFVITDVAVAMYGVSQTCLILVFIFRVHLTFRASTMECSESTVNRLYLCFTCCALSYFFMTVFYPASKPNLAYFFTAMWSALYFALCVMLPVLFVRKLDQMIAETTVAAAAIPHNNQTVTRVRVNSGAAALQSNSTISPIPEDRETDEASKKSAISSTNFMFIAVKHALLVPLAIGCSSVCGIVSVVIVLVAHDDAVFAFAATWVCCGSAVSSLCTYLVFANDSASYSTFCRRLHKWCQQCRLWHIQRNMDGRNEETEKPVPSLEGVAEKSLSLVKHDSNPTPAQTIPSMDL